MPISANILLQLNEIKFKVLLRKYDEVVVFDQGSSMLWSKFDKRFLCQNTLFTNMIFMIK